MYVCLILKKRVKIKYVMWGAVLSDDATVSQSCRIGLKGFAVCLRCYVVPKYDVMDLLKSWSKTFLYFG